MRFKLGVYEIYSNQANIFNLFYMIQKFRPGCSFDTLVHWYYLHCWHLHAAFPIFKKKILIVKIKYNQ